MPDSPVPLLMVFQLFCRQCLLDMDPTFFVYAMSSLEAYIAIAILPMLRGAKHFIGYFAQIDVRQCGKSNET